METEVKISSIAITQLPELDQSSLFSFRVASSIVYGTEASEIWHFSQIYFIFKEHEKLTFCVLKFLKWRKNITRFFLKILQTRREVEKIIPSVSLRCIIANILAIFDSFFCLLILKYIIDIMTAHP